MIKKPNELLVFDILLKERDFGKSQYKETKNTNKRKKINEPARARKSFGLVSLMSLAEFLIEF